MLPVRSERPLPAKEVAALSPLKASSSRATQPLLISKLPGGTSLTLLHITLSLTGVLNEPVDIQLFDASGRAISEWNFSLRESGDKQMSTESLAKGVYILRFSQNNGEKVHSLRIMRR